jgi:hypothetical protein
MEALCSSETSVAKQRTTRRHIPEDDTLQKSVSFTAPLNMKKVVSEKLSFCLYVRLAGA